MTPTVVDASVLAALLFGEPRAEEAADCLEGAHLLAPTLLRYELANAGARKAGRRPGQAAAVYDALAMFEAMQIHEVQVPAAPMARLAGAAQLTAYDAAYLWLARHVRGRLLTFDERLAAALEKLDRRDPA